jgi:Mce-associated membrane protein
MTKPHSGGADEKSDQPKGESAAVRVRTDAASEQDTVEAETAEPVEGEANQPNDTENTVGAEDAGEADAAVIDDAEEVEQKRQGVEPDKAKRRIELPRTRGVNGGRRGEGLRSRLRRATKPDAGEAEGQSEEQAEKSVEGEAKEASDATAPTLAKDSSDADAAISDAEDGEAEAGEEAEEGAPAKAKLRVSWSRVLVYGVLPGLALLLAATAGILKWQDSSARASQIARIESVAAAKDSTIALLSYKSDSVDKDLDAAKSRLTGTFKESYLQLINDVVIPGAKRDHISTTATVPAAASVSATPSHAVTLLFVNQTAVVDKSPPTDTTSSVRVTLDKIAGRWLISGFDPV